MARDDDLAGMSREMREMIPRDRDRWAGLVAEARKRRAIHDLIGMTAAQARVAVEAAGGEFVPDQEPSTTKLDPNRVTALSKNGYVTGTLIG